MDEATRCDRVAMIHQGRIMKLGTPDSIIAGYQGSLMAISSKDRHKPKTLLSGLEEIESLFAFGDAVHVSLKTDNPAAVEKINDTLQQGMDAPYQIEKITPSFEDCFLQLMTQGNT
jgi:ABC-type multidrug transport system ATPase subunit